MSDMFEAYDGRMAARHPGWAKMTEWERDDWYLSKCVPGWSEMTAVERVVAKMKLDAETIDIDG